MWPNEKSTFDQTLAQADMRSFDPHDGRATQAAHVRNITHLFKLPSLSCLSLSLSLSLCLLRMLWIAASFHGPPDMWKMLTNRLYVQENINRLRGWQYGHDRH